MRMMTTATSADDARRLTSTPKTAQHPKTLRRSPLPAIPLALNPEVGYATVRPLLGDPKRRDWGLPL